MSRSSAPDGQGHVHDGIADRAHLPSGSRCALGEGPVP